jgi:glycerophosphoryl diester phosphodiesterase
MITLVTRKDFCIFFIIFSICGCNSIREKELSTKYVKVIAHRGDWRNAPENSLRGLQNCIELGVDMVEVDLAMTKDSVLVLMHDETIDRTTSGEGFIHNWILDSLQKLNLKLYDGTLTQEKIPTLEDFMMQSKGKTEVFIDKGYQYIEQAYRILEKTGTLDEAHFLGFVSGDQYQQDYPEVYKLVNYIPLILPSDTIVQQLTSYEQIRPQYYLYSFQDEDALQLSTVTNTASKAYAIATTQVGRYCAGHTDSLSLRNPGKGWGWVIDNGFNSICTDFPEQLIAYLESKGLRSGQRAPNTHK